METIPQDISIDEITKKPKFSDFFNQSDLIEHIYKNSKIDLELHGKTCALISMESSNNQESIDKMEYWYYNNYVNYFYEHLNKGKTNENPENQNEEFTNQMESAKNMYKNSGLKMPKKIK